MAVADTFDRADGGLGANWTVQKNAPTIVSNTARGPVGTGDHSAAFWNANTFSADQSSFANIGAIDYVGITVRASGTGASSNWYSYFNNGQIQKSVAGSVSTLATDATFANTDTAKLAVVGTTLTPYVNGVPGTPVVDSSLSSGSPGIIFYDVGNAVAIEDWIGTGEVVVVASDAKITVRKAFPPQVGWAVNRPAAGGLYSLPTRLFPVANWWNKDISGVAVDPDSASLLAANPGTLQTDWGNNYGFPYVTVSGNHATIEFAGGSYWSESDHVGYPIPAQALTQIGWSEQLDRTITSNVFGGDRHLLIVDVDNQLLYEIYQPFYNATGSPVTFGGDGTSTVQPGQYFCASACYWDMKTNNTRPDGWTSSDAAGLQVLPGLVQYDEVIGTAPITHAHRMALDFTANYYVWPATHKAFNGGTIPLGARLRLKAIYDITRGGQNGVNAQRLLQAFKTYGLIVADNGGHGLVQGTNDTRWGNYDSAIRDELSTAFGFLNFTNLEIVTLGVV